MNKTEHMTPEQFKNQPKCSGRTGKQISRAEINYEALYIKPRVATGEIKSYRTQVEFELWPKTMTDRRIVFTPDFVIEYANGLKVVVEMKGRQVRKFQRDYPLRRRRFKEIYPQYEFREEKSEDWT